MPQASTESTIRRGFVLQPTYRIERNRPVEVNEFR